MSTKQMKAIARSLKTAASCRDAASRAFPKAAMNRRTPNERRLFVCHSWVRIVSEEIWAIRGVTAAVVFLKGSEGLKVDLFGLL
jgi:hypothetical protein